MLRFKPDHWSDALLRPWLMGDPAAGLYYELSAPDWRFGALALVTVLAFTAGRGRACAAAPQRRALLMLLVLFYGWTFVIGNGRYFIVGLLMVGPLLVMAWQWLPGDRGIRWLLLLGFVAMQGLTVHWSHRLGSWGEAVWVSGPSVQLDDAPVRHAPAVFVTPAMNGYSVLVPLFHPQSRWVKLGQQMDYRPGTPEHRDLQALFASTLPFYVVAPAIQQDDLPVQQPNELMRRMTHLLLARFPLTMKDAPCEILHTNLLPSKPRPAHGGPAPRQAFWVCPLRVTATPMAQSSEATQAQAAVEQVFADIEAYCPRFFPAGHGITHRAQDHWQRLYPITDTRVYLDDSGTVSYRYFRSFNDVRIGTADDIRAGRLTFDCSSLIGRYQPPWRRD